MKANKRIVISALAMAICFVIIIDSIRINQTFAIPVKPDLQLPKRRSNFLQEKSRYKYLGRGKCAYICHNNEEMGYQYDILRNSPHANSYKILGDKKALSYAKNANVTGDPQKSPVCLKCHVTGGGNDLASFTATYKEEDGVTCEACHKGEFISETFLPKEKDCLKCHNNSVHKIPIFIFKQRAAKIAHPRPKVKAVKNNPVAENGIPYESDNSDEKSHYIGEKYGGGIVFYSYDGGQHGLIATTADPGKGIKWDFGVNSFTGSTNDGVGAGAMNTSKIVFTIAGESKTVNIAAKVCADYSITVDGVTYNDWYLPSKYELNLLYSQKTLVGGFGRGYWSSTEVDIHRAWTQYFDSGFQFSYGGKDYSGYVRAIRAF